MVVVEHETAWVVNHATCIEILHTWLHRRHLSREHTALESSVAWIQPTEIHLLLLLHELSHLRCHSSCHHHVKKLVLLWIDLLSRLHLLHLLVVLHIHVMHLLKELLLI